MILKDRSIQHWIWAPLGTSKSENSVEIFRRLKLTLRNLTLFLFHSAFYKKERKKERMKLQIILSYGQFYISNRG